jgi:hypothetical protein
MQKIRDQAKNHTKRSVLLESQILGEKQGPIIPRSLIATHPVDDRALFPSFSVQHPHAFLFHITALSNLLFRDKSCSFYPIFWTKRNTKKKKDKKNMPASIELESQNPYNGFYGFLNLRMR